MKEVLIQTIIAILLTCLIIVMIISWLSALYYFIIYMFIDNSYLLLAVSYSVISFASYVILFVIFN
jgi:hypothetical protein